jgi:hypothetical protein
MDVRERRKVYASEARRCRLEASRHAGKPEEPFLLRLAAEFDRLKVGGRTDSTLSDLGGTCSPPRRVQVEGGSTD